MGPRRKASTPKPDGDAPATITVVPPQAPAPPASALPPVLRFPLYIVLSFSLSALTKSLYYELNGPELQVISRPGDPQWQLPAITLWKGLELAVGWFSGFDASDMFAFTLLTHVPHALLLNTFYLVPLTPLAFLLITTCLSNALPLRLLRRRLAHNLPSSHTHEQITSDPTIWLLAGLLATLLYALPLLLSYATWLPQHLAVHLTSIKSLAPAHDASLPLLAALLLPLGWASLAFNFYPAAHALASAAPARYSVPLDFDPVTATLSQTLHRNILWHLYLPARTQDLLARTATVMLWTLANTAFWPWFEIDGCDLAGTLAWALIWGVGAGSAGLALGWVAGVLS